MFCFVFLFVFFKSVSANISQSPLRMRLIEINLYGLHNQTLSIWTCSFKSSHFKLCIFLKSDCEAVGPIHCFSSFLRHAPVHGDHAADCFLLFYKGTMFSCYCEFTAITGYFKLFPLLIGKCSRPRLRGMQQARSTLRTNTWKCVKILCLYVIILYYDWHLTNCFVPF